jgi:hypothetical protein
MHKWKKGTLKSGGSGKPVRSQKQAVAIMLSERRNEKAHGGKYMDKSRRGSGPVDLHGNNVVQQLDHHTVGEGADNSMVAAAVNAPLQDKNCKDENWALDNPKKCGL